MNLNLGIHDVTSITTQAKCLNGQWQTKVFVRCGDGSESELTLYTPSRLSVVDLPDEHVRVSDSEYTVERRPTPFEPAYSAQASLGETK